MKAIDYDIFIFMYLYDLHSFLIFIYMFNHHCLCKTNSIIYLIYMIIFLCLCRIRIQIINLLNACDFPPPHNLF